MPDPRQRLTFSSFLKGDFPKQNRMRFNDFPLTAPTGFFKAFLPQTTVQRRLASTCLGLPRRWTTVCGVRPPPADYVKTNVLPGLYFNNPYTQNAFFELSCTTMGLYQRCFWERFKSILIPLTHFWLLERFCATPHTEIACGRALSLKSAFGANLCEASILKSCVKR